MVRSALLALCAACVLSGPSALAGGAEEDGPGMVYPAEADAGAIIDEALSVAQQRGAPALIVFGSNWCHDSVGLAERLHSGSALAQFMADHYEVAYVDIGTRHRNLDQLHRFGVEHLFGTPTLVVADDLDAVRNRATVHDWRAVYNAGDADLAAYFARLVEAETVITPAASVDIEAAVAVWPPYQAALEGLDAVDEAERDLARAYYDGFARSVARNVMGRVALAGETTAAARTDLEALGLTAEADLTEAVIERMARSRFDIEARRQADREETQAAIAEDLAGAAAAASGPEAVDG